MYILYNFDLTRRFKIGDDNLFGSVYLYSYIPLIEHKTYHREADFERLQ